jgi:copper chaperone CopZ
MQIFSVTGMHCEQCVQKIQNGVENLEGVTDPRVTLVPPRLTIADSSEIPFDVLRNAVKHAGDYSLTHEHVSDKTFLPDTKAGLMPLFIIAGYILGGAILTFLLSSERSLTIFMSHFMGLFFITFSLFKMIDLRGFKDAFVTYDLLAKKYPLYAAYYPFLELLLGILYVTETLPFITNLVTVCVMGIGALGVARALMKDETIQCACLGTTLNLPMTRITLLEDVLMGVMAGFMLVV